MKLFLVMGLHTKQRGGWVGSATKKGGFPHLEGDVVPLKTQHLEHRWVFILVYHDVVSREAARRRRRQVEPSMQQKRPAV